MTLSPSPPLSSAHASEDEDETAGRGAAAADKVSAPPTPRAARAEDRSRPGRTQSNTTQSRGNTRQPTGNTREPTDENIDAMWTLLRARRPSSDVSPAAGLDHLRRDTQRRFRVGSRGHAKGPGATAWARSRSRSGHGDARGGPQSSKADREAVPDMKLSVMEEELKRQVAQLDERVRQIDARMAERGEGHVLPPDPMELLAEQARLQRELEESSATRRRAGSARLPPRPPQHGRPPRGGSGRSAPAATQRRRASGLSSAAKQQKQQPPPTRAEVEDMEAAMQAMLAANARPVKPRPPPRRPVETNSYLDRFASSTGSR